MRHAYFFSPFVDACISLAKTFGYYSSLFFFGYLAIPEQATYLLIMLMSIDMLCGILKSYRIFGGTSLTSHKATVGIIKKSIIIIVICTIAIVFKLAGGIDPHITLSGLIMMFGLAEAYSILGNAYAAYTLKQLPEFDATSEIFKWLGRLISAKIEKVTKKDDDDFRPPMDQLPEKE